jgi:glutathione synthase/RimK-type ligase-like ATP-grasp enzyme
MKVAIHFEQEKRNFCHGWIEACEHYGIEYLLINCFDSDIVNMVNDVDYVMWHWYQSDPTANQIATPILLSFEMKGVKTFPDSKMALFFDNKVSQKYLFDAIKVNRINTYVFYDVLQAKGWAQNAQLPVVHKLKGGAGSVNVSLIKSRRKLNHLIRKAFGRGLNSINYYNVINDRLKKFKKLPTFINLYSLSGSIWYLLKSKISSRNKEKGYIYFQDYHHNSFDIRIVVVGQKAIGIKRLNRKDSFKASGSGNIIFDHSQIPLDCIAHSFEAVRKIDTKIAAFDFLKLDGRWCIVEMSYGFVSKAYEKCEGYWDNDLNWFDEQIIPERLMIDSLMNKNEYK